VEPAVGGETSTIRTYRGAHLRAARRVRDCAQRVDNFGKVCTTCAQPGETSIELATQGNTREHEMVDGRGFEPLGSGFQTPTRDQLPPYLWTPA
jgi:hypothetical protein